MKFLCLICAEKVMEQMPADAAEKHFQEYAAFTEDIRRSGHYVGCNRLLPPDAATTIRVRDGLLGDKVFALATTGDGSLWVGGFGGVARLRPLSAL